MAMPCCRFAWQAAAAFYGVMGYAGRRSLVGVDSDTHQHS